MEMIRVTMGVCCTPLPTYPAFVSLIFSVKQNVKNGDEQKGEPEQ